MTSSNSSSNLITLAVDTSSWTCAIALYRGAEPLIEINRAKSRNHTQTLLALIDFALAQSGIELGAVDRYAIGVGPGSFTGLRIGMTIMKTLSWDHAKPLIPVNSLQALALGQLGCNEPIVAMQDARKKEVYASLHRFENGRLQTLHEPVVSSVDDFLAAIKDVTVGAKPVFVGTGAVLYHDTICRQFETLGEIPAIAIAHEIRGNAIARLSLDLPGLHRDSARLLQPLYIRKSEAEIGLEARRRLASQT